MVLVSSKMVAVATCHVVGGVGVLSWGTVGVVGALGQVVAVVMLNLLVG